MPETAAILAWTLQQEIQTPADVNDLLVDAEVELWTKAGHIKARLTKGAVIRRIDSLIAWAVLHKH